MPYTELDYLVEVKHIQDLTREKQDKFVFITYKEIWRQLRNEKRFFRGYRTYLKYINEAQVNTRIARLKPNDE